MKPLTELQEWNRKLKELDKEIGQINDRLIFCKPEYIQELIQRRNLISTKRYILHYKIQNRRCSKPFLGPLALATVPKYAAPTFASHKNQ